MTYYWDDKFTTWDFDDHPQYVAFHATCWELAHRVVAYLAYFPKSIDSGSRTIGMLVRIFEDREEQRIDPSPNAYPGGTTKRPKAWIPSPVSYYDDTTEDNWTGPSFSSITLPVSSSIILRIIY